MAPVSGRRPPAGPSPGPTGRPRRPGAEPTHASPAARELRFPLPRWASSDRRRRDCWARRASHLRRTPSRFPGGPRLSATTRHPS